MAVIIYCLAMNYEHLLDLAILNMIVLFLMGAILFILGRGDRVRHRV